MYMYIGNYVIHVHCITHYMYLHFMYSIIGIGKLCYTYTALHTACTSLHVQYYRHWEIMLYIIHTLIQCITHYMYNVYM